MSSVAENPSAARMSCITCRNQKRKCSKEIPACELCRRNQRRCEYPVECPIGSTAELSMGYKVSTEIRPTFPALVFFDYYTFQGQRNRVEIPRVDLPWEFRSAIGGPDQVVRELDAYFSSFQLFFPVVSKLRMHHNLTTNIEHLTADTVLLLLTMRLMLHIDRNPSPENALYDQVKRCNAFVERSGVVTMKLLQSNLLLAFYEFSHAIFPAAYFTIRHSASIGLALGIHSRSPPFQVLSPSTSWCELEERRRTWWGVIMLDRYINIGTGSNEFSCADAKPNDLLPMNEECWDKGESTLIQSLAVSSSTDVTASPFTRASQAAHLLSRILRHINGKHDDYQTYYDEAKQLHYIITSFHAALSQEFLNSEDEVSQIRLLTAVGLCFSAKMALYDTYTCAEVDINGGIGTDAQLSMQQIALNEIKHTCLAVYSLANTLISMSNGGADVRGMSPLVCNCLYAAGMHYSCYIRETRQVEMQRGLAVILESLRGLGAIWGIAREYLNVLESGNF
ncbi:hypothetical protein K505DRAFT_271080 [Melanomma pulvis-pyrius CBS 109.77]|uniref:Zn(2)-C6 fungal-type domain-containing protein n=1 Tax=Melanomma pulvis-pyrius CBS 109.77 TaxID=1314802 RepID=A0A6A6XKJ0_9PLEO|nr:hypothetical protein K505DRAFT_271080 [Melanomma pulvis-pyrius CBS 109.77]